MKSRFQKFAAVFGGILIGLGVILNQWVLTKLLSFDGNLETPTKIMVWTADLVLVVLGAWIYANRRNRKLIGNMLLFFVTLFFCLVAAELILRVSRVIEQKYQSLTMHRKSGPFRGNPYGTGSYRLRPNLDMMLDRGERVLTNSLGMRWREASYDNPGGRQRIAFVGDSFTFGMAASSIEKSFVGVFDSKMDSNRFEVLNFGVPGYGFLDYELIIREEVVRFKPTHIIIASYNGNDFSDTYFGLNRFALWNGYLGKGVLPEIVRKLPPQFQRGSKKEELLASTELHNRLTAVMNKIHEAFYWHNPPWINFWVDDNFGGSSVFWSRKEYPSVAVDAKDQSLAILSRIHRFCRERGIQLVVVTIPFAQQIYALSEQGDDYDIRYPQKYIEDFAQTEKIPYLDLLPLLRSNETVTHENIFSPESHFNDDGYRIVGELITGFFIKDVLRQT